MNKNERCQHPDCVYRNRSDPIQTGNCNYAMMTGKSRIAGLPERLRLPCNCPRYVPDGTTPKTSTVLEWETVARALYNAGATDREIADSVGKSADTIGEMRRKRWHMPPNPDRRGPAVKFDWERALDLYRHGANDLQIAQALGCSLSRVWKWRTKQELFPNGTAGRKAQR